MRLYWNRKGEINCGKHAPYPGTDTWEHEYWMEIPATVVVRHQLRCENGVDCGERPGGPNATQLRIE